MWNFEAPPPAVAGDYAAAAGLRPLEDPLSFLWQIPAAPLFRHFGISGADKVLRAAGCAGLALLAFLSYWLFAVMMPASLMRGVHIAAWWRLAVRVVVFQGVLLYCCSDPVWNAFLRFKPLSIELLLATGAALCAALHFRRRREGLPSPERPLFGAYFLLGVLAPQNPVAAAAAAVLASAVFFSRLGALRAARTLAVPIRNPLAEYFLSWRSTLAFAAGAGVSFWLMSRVFAATDAFDAFGWKTWRDCLAALPVLYVQKAAAAATPLGIMLFAAFAVLPPVLQSRLFGQAADLEKHLRYFHGFVFAVLGVFAFTQLAGAGDAWYWRWGGGLVRDGLLKSVSAFLSALAAVWSVAVFLQEMFFRNFRRLQTLAFPDAAAAPGAAKLFASAERMQRLIRSVFLVEPLLAAACVVPFRMQKDARYMAGVVADAVRETALECAGVERVFTDGGLDACVELAAADKGRKLHALSFMRGSSEKRDIWLRTRAAKDEAERKQLEYGAADAMRAWVRLQPEKNATFAAQIGFELWRRTNLPMPEFSGLAAFPGGVGAAESKRAVEAARAIANRIDALYEDGLDPEAVLRRDVRDAFAFVQWRLAIIARHRANAEDGAGDVQGAMCDTAIADTLDRHNAVLAKIRADMSFAGRRKVERLTAREGLRIALAKANFPLARQFAMGVLAADTSDPSANFAVGMDFFVQEQYSRAEAYLEKCLEARPRDPAVLNNLAQCRLRRGDRDKALEYAERALEFLPDSPEIKRTLERARSMKPPRASKTVDKRRN